MSTRDQEEMLAISLIRSHVFGASDGPKRMSEAQRTELEREMEQSQAGKDEANAEDATAPSAWSLFKKRQFAPMDLLAFSRFENCTGVVISIASLFVAIVNIGATYQTNAVRENPRVVHGALHGRIDQGLVGAFDEIDGDMRRVDGIATPPFPRGTSQGESARCARESLLYGRDAVRSDPCTWCWTEDIIFCARSHRALVFLQSNLINTVPNFEVGEDAITAAACEEAMCKLAFVPCVGSSQRRMNVTSSIARPGRQLCNVVDWEDVFDENGSYHKLLEVNV